MSVSNPLVSVVIPAYNAANHIGLAIESAFAQSYRPIEVIVADDGSTDETAAVVNRYPEVAYLYHANGGPAKARNSASKIAQGRYLAFLDSDDLWTDTKIEEQVAIMEARPNVGLLFGDMRRFCGNDYEPTMFERYQFTNEYFGDSILIVDQTRKLLETNFIPTSSVMIRRDVFFNVGKFDEDHDLRGVEDWHFWLRVAFRYPIAHSTSVWKLKRVHETNLSNNTEGMARAAIRAIEMLSQSHGAEILRGGIKIGYALKTMYRNLGYFYLRNLRLSESRSAFCRSLSFGADVRTLVYWLSTFMGRRMINKVLRARE